MFRYVKQELLYKQDNFLITKLTENYPVSKLAKYINMCPYNEKQGYSTNKKKLRNAIIILHICLLTKIPIFRVVKSGSNLNSTTAGTTFSIENIRFNSTVQLPS